MSALDDAWSTLKGEYLHPSVRLHAEMSAADLGMSPPPPERTEDGELESLKERSRRLRTYAMRRRQAEGRVGTDGSWATTVNSNPSGRPLTNVVQRMPRNDDDEQS